MIILYESIRLYEFILYERERGKSTTCCEIIQPSQITFNMSPNPIELHLNYCKLSYVLCSKMRVTKQLNLIFSLLHGRIKCPDWP